jgi:exosortase/archaeosortase family protein
MLIPAERAAWIPAVAAVLGVVGGSLIISDALPAKVGKGGWAALFLLAIAAALRVGSAYYYLEWFDRLSLIGVVLAAVPLVLGTEALRRTWPALCFLVFMVPLPYRLEVAMRDPLRRIGTEVTTYAMQTMGIPAFAEGNVIVIPREGPPPADTDTASETVSASEQADSHEIRIGVVEACSGLRMMMVFVALSSAMALVTIRPLWQKAILLAAAVPIALASNILRILATGLMRVWGWDHLADLAFHDLAGWLMMPMGLLMLGVLFWFMDRLFVVEEERPLAVGLNVQPTPATEPRELQGMLR